VEFTFQTLRRQVLFREVMSEWRNYTVESGPERHGVEQGTPSGASPCCSPKGSTNGLSAASDFKAFQPQRTQRAQRYKYREYEWLYNAQRFHSLAATLVFILHPLSVDRETSELLFCKVFKFYWAKSIPHFLNSPRGEEGGVFLPGFARSPL
jgi:hypothetical protein